MGQLDGDELDSFFELIGGLLLMLICAFAIARMGTKMVTMINHYHHVDKTETRANAPDVNNPFVYTGYQAYMLSWMMDPYSDVSVTWMTNGSARTDGLDTDHVTICTLDENGSPVYNFIPYRNQLITGGHAAPVANVKNILRNVHPSQVDALYAYDTAKCGHLFTLIYTGNYTNSEVPVYAPDGTTIFSRRKDYSWIILPK